MVSDYITADRLRDYLDERKAWNLVLEYLGAELETGNGPSSVSEEQIIKCFSSGALADDSIRRLIHPNPLPNLTEIGAYSDPDLAYHLGGGLREAMRISRLAAENGVPISGVKKMLDFGCGTSRILRYFAYFYPNCDLYGVDVFDKSVAWGQHAFPNVNYRRIQNQPPMDFADQFFDLIYAFSIFTHYEEKTHLAWIEELSRVLAERGIVVMTVTGNHLVTRCERDQELRARIGLDVSDATYSVLVDQFRDDGYIFVDCYNRESLSSDGLDSSIFGKSFVSRSYIDRNWYPYFDCLAYHEGIVAGMQDYIVLQKK